MNDWAQNAAREICDSFPSATPRMQSEAMAEIIRRHAEAAGQRFMQVVASALKAIAKLPVHSTPRAHRVRRGSR